MVRLPSLGTVSSVGAFGQQVRDFRWVACILSQCAILWLSALSRGVASIDMPISAQADLDKIYQYSSKSTMNEHPETSRNLRWSTFRTSNRKGTGRYSFRVAMMRSGEPEVAIYHLYYKLYHDASYKMGLNSNNFFCHTLIKKDPSVFFI